MESTTCPSCGGTVPSARFCASCGQPLTGRPAPATLPASPTEASLAAASAPPAVPEPTQLSTHNPTPSARDGSGWEPTLAVPTPEARDLPQPLSWDAAPGAASVLPDDGEAVNPGRAGTNKRLGIGAVTAVLLAGAAYLVFGVGTEAHTLNGDLSLSATGTLSPGDACTGSGGYDDIHEGTQVIVEDETGKTLATSAFGPGTYDGQSCVFTFRFSDVPKAAFYRVHQSGNRGVLQYSYQDLVDADWSVHLTLGDNSGTN